ncbi:TolC family outer membrane protein [Burkholderia guangdongensis]|uniref:TolC family outer membrane protein n=1 Tax=Burkholderia guangdongensis TaxID=1792500 RepID=UPI001FEA2C02|nr:TolC family outer membrane protein [Burkholderia guangdongensis]
MSMVHSECRRGRAARARARTRTGSPRVARIVAVLLAIAAAFAQPRHASALGLVDVYEAALTHDPVLAQAQKQKEADDANRAIGRSYLLPNLSANYGEYREKTETTGLGQAQGGGDLTSSSIYHAYARGISLRQPLINFEGIARYRYGNAMALAGDATYEDHREDLLLRVLSAYTDTAFAQEQLNLADAHKRTLDAQLAGNETSLRLGTGTRTEVLETTAKADLAQADVSDARDSVDNFSHALEALTGLSASLDVASLDRLKDGFRPAMPAPMTFDAWRDIALDSNASLIAERHAVEAARQQMNISRAGYLPRVDLVAGLSQNQSNTVDAIGNRYLTKSIGVELTIPLYSGGMVQASTAQSRANYERMQFELQDKTNKVLLELRKQYNICVSSATRIDALAKAVDSANLLITATRKGIQAGERTNVDLLGAEEQLYQARRDLSRARYQYLFASLQLKYVAGTLTEQDLVEIAQWFVPASGKTAAAPAAGATLVSK